MFMKERKITRPLPRHPIIKEVKEREEVKEVREGTQQKMQLCEALEKMC
jgi:hypothetical protein